MDKMEHHGRLRRRLRALHSEVELNPNEGSQPSEICDFALLKYQLSFRKPATHHSP